MNKKNIKIIAIIIIIIAILVVIIIKNPKKERLEPISQSEIEINKAISSDDTKSITNNIDNIKIDDTTSADLAPADKELENL